MDQPLTKKIVLLSLTGSFLAVLAIAFHHHHRFFLWSICSICQVKTSISGTVSKNKIDSPSAAAAPPPGNFMAFFGTAVVLTEAESVPPLSPAAFVYLNKSPPARV